MNIESIKKDDSYPEIVIVTDINGAQMRYRMDDGGVLRPGRVWECLTPIHQIEQYSVTFFIPLPDGQPEIIQVRAL